MKQWTSRFLALILLSAIATGAQRSPEEVTIVLSATDKYGRALPNITKDDLEVREDGATRQITKFDSVAATPITMEVLVDSSGSMTIYQGVVSAMAKQFLGLTIRKGQDTVTVRSFGGASMLEQGATDDLSQLRAGIDRAAAGAESRGALYDALFEAAKRLSSAPGRRIILITTDGGNNSSHVSRAKTIETLQRSGVSVFGLFAYRDVGEMRKLIEDTGGWRYSPPVPRNVADIDSDLRQLARRVASQYLVTFQSAPPKKPGDLRKILIRSVRTDLKDARFAYQQRH